MSRARDLADGTFSGAVVGASADFTGTVEAADFSDGTLTVGTEYVTNGSAKAWSEFTITASVNDSFNVSSMSDNGAGEYQTNLTNSMANATYVALGNVENYNAFLTTANKAASSWINYTSRDDNSGLADLTSMQNVAHGDLA